MFHIQCKSQDGVVKSFSFPFQLPDSHARFAGAGCTARLEAPALPGTAVREEEPGTAGGRLGLHQAWPGGGRGAGGRGARFRGLRGRGRRFGERGPGREAGAEAGTQGQPAESSRWGAAAAGRRAGGRPEECRAGGPGAPRRQEGTLSLTSGDDSQSGLSAPRTPVRESQARRRAGG